MRKVTVLAALLLLAPAVSQAKSLEDLLVEKGVITKGEAQGATAGGASKVYWNNGTRVEFPDTGFSLNIGTLIQTRYTFTDNDNGNRNTSSFDVNKTKLIFSGNALHEEFNYHVETNLVGSVDGDGNRSPALDDAYIVWNGCDWVSLKMGQYKTGISRQELSGDARLMFADRSNVSNYFRLGRQDGLSGKWMSSDQAWVLGAGVFNGGSDGEGVNNSGVDTNMMAQVNLRWNVMGKMDSYEEGDVNWTNDAAVSLGGAYAYSDNRNDRGMGVENIGQHTVDVDANFKYQGWSFNGEFFYRNENPDEGDDITPMGFYAQGGYFVMPKKMEVALRYGYLDCDDGQGTGTCAGLDKVNEVAATLNYYWWAHHLKAQFGYAFQNRKANTDGVADDSTNRWIFQLTSWF